MIEIPWNPLGGSQTDAYNSPCNDILFEGTRGPGKTECQLMFFRKHVGQGYGKFWRGVIFDREYKNLDDMVSKSERLYPLFKDGAQFRRAAKDYKWVWPTGEELLFRAALDERGYWAYHGQEFPFIGINELASYPTPKFKTMIQSCNRSGFLPAKHAPHLPPIPLVMFQTANPYGAGHNWVKALYIDPAPPGHVMRTQTDVFNPQTQKEETVTRTRVRIFGSFRENKFLDPVYIAGLENETDENRRKAWLHGDWNIVAGGALDDVWDEVVLRRPRFQAPPTWRLDRSFDWGSSDPFSVGWWATANGEEATMPDGSKWCPVAGSLIRIAEWYGTRSIGSNEGLKMTARAIADGIKSMETKLKADGWISKAVRPGPADNQISNVNEEETDSIARKMSMCGIDWTVSDKSPGSRINGLELLRERLVAAKKGEGPAIYFCENCTATFSTLPVLPRDPKRPEDVDTDSEDHVYDEIRYRVLAAPKQYVHRLDVRNFV